MNISILYLLAAMLALYAISPVQGSCIVINEIEINPPGNDGARLNQFSEWVEFYNNCTSIQNIGGWNLTAYPLNVTITIPFGVIIYPGDYYVMQFKGEHLPNSYSYLVLSDSNNHEIDRTPELSDGADDDFSWRRMPDGRDSDSINDWTFALSSPGF